MISILAPSRSRPEKSFATIQHWKQSSGKNHVEIIVSLDQDDCTFDTYFHLYKTDPTVKIIKNPNRSAVDAINNAAKVATGDIFIVVSDDTSPIDNFDELILKEVQGKTDWILKTQDGIQDWILTNPILDRAYYNRFGYIYYPEYLHMFCDTHLTAVADLTGRKLTSKLMFKHNHYSVTKEAPDAVNKKADSTWAQGEKLFLELARQNFLLKPEEIKGKITSQSYINWMKNKGVIVR